MAFCIQYIFFILLIATLHLKLVLLQKYEANIVAIFASESELQLNTEAVKASVFLGIKEANKRYSPSIEFKLKLKNDSRSCFENYAGVLAAEEYYRGKVTAFVGPACSKALDSVSRMASYWGIPIYTAGGVDTLFSRKNIFSTLTRLSFSLDQVCRFMLQIFMEFEWKHIVIIVDEAEPSEILLRNNFAMVMRETQYRLYLSYKEFNSKFDTSYRNILTSGSKDGRVFLLLACGEVVRKMLLAAYDLGMGNGEYVFLSVELLKSEVSSNQFNWNKENDDRNEEARKIYESLMVISVRVPVRPEYQDFISEVIEVTKQEFSTDISPYSVNPMVSSFFDCVLLYAYSLNKTIFEGEDPSDGFIIARQIWNETFFGGLTGDITINENGDREADYTLNDLDPTGNMTPVATYFGGRKVYEKINGREIYWPENRGPPLDVPICGFDGSAPNCLAPYVFPLEGMILLSLAAVACLGSIIGFFMYKKLLLETQLADMWWQIDWADIELLDINHLGSSLSFARSHNSQQTRSTPTKRSSGAESVFPSSAGVQVGSYKGIKVAIKYLRGVNKIQVSRNLLIELKLMRDMTHENLLRFVGLCVTDPNFAIITDFCTRGRLSDMLSNEAINIDWIFSCSLITDIAEGINFIHGSKLEYHGHLKSENCLIDGRFVVKLSNYGMKELWRQVPPSEVENAGSLLWTAPEHLRSKNPRLQGSKKGDVYSFAIVLQEIVTRRSPFEAPEREGSQPVYLTSEDIIERLQTGTNPPYRPDIAEGECPPDMLELIRMCWEEDPDARPNFPDVKHKLRRITKGMSSKNFLDNLLNRMEQYANDLESLVEEKTQSLVDEKKKTDELLYQMIPRYVADELKKGCHVKPEYFDSVTIFFSDIVGFTQLSAESTPLQVVDFLNDLYSCFDSIIENFDVYKVETIGDAYMVASGLPVRNGNEHAREIARLALKLLAELADFKIRHKPNRKLKLRIGIHSGPCVAGVVGLKMPRYCLFGDTVNTASRMESTSEALKIHISHQTKAILDFFRTFIIIPRGEIEVKKIQYPVLENLECIFGDKCFDMVVAIFSCLGKGTMKTYWLENEMGKPTL